MSNHTFTRRKFISAVTVAGTATTVLPFQTLGNEPVKRPDGEKIKIVSVMGLSADEQARIRDISDKVELTVLQNNKPIPEDAEVVLGSISPEMLQRAKNIKWVQVNAAGVEWLQKEVIDHPLVLTNMQRIFAPVIAETAIGLLLSLTRGIAHFAIPNFNNKKYAGEPPTGIVLDDLYNKTIGIVGMGGIGSETAKRLHYGFQMKVLATDAKPLPKPDFVNELHDPSWLMKMVPQVDVLMSAAPLTSRTKEMFNEEVFAKMKPTAYFINVSRGGLVKQSALIDALKNKKIRGAGLDVVTPEPLPSDNPLWTCPNLVITAHNSGHAEIRHKRMMDLITENVRRYAIGEPLMNVVDKKKGY